MTHGERLPAGPARGIVQRATPVGDLHHERLLPSEALAPAVAHFWSVAWRLGAPFDAETLPHPSVHITFERTGATEVAWVGGVATGRFARRLDGAGLVFGIKLRPGALVALSDVSAAELTDRREPIGAIFGEPGEELAREVLACQTTSERIDRAEAFLLLHVRPLPVEARRVRDMVERMSQDRALVRVDQVAAEMRVEVRTLERAFARYVGVSPKWVLGRYRLHEAAEALRAPEPPSLAALAASLGYADQAHFARDFRKTLGRSPRAYARVPS